MSPWLISSLSEKSSANGMYFTSPGHKKNFRHIAIIASRDWPRGIGGLHIRPLWPSLDDRCLIAVMVVICVLYFEELRPIQLSIKLRVFPLRRAAAKTEPV